jgi:hypothetical protein
MSTPEPEPTAETTQKETFAQYGGEAVDPNTEPTTTEEPFSQLEGGKSKKSNKARKSKKARKSRGKSKKGGSGMLATAAAPATLFLTQKYLQKKNKSGKRRTRKGGRKPRKSKK